MTDRIHMFTKEEIEELNRNCERLLDYGELTEYVHTHKLTKPYAGINSARLHELESMLLVRFDERKGYYRLTNSGVAYMKECRRNRVERERAESFPEPWYKRLFRK